MGESNTVQLAGRREGSWGEKIVRKAAFLLAFFTFVSCTALGQDAEQTVSGTVMEAGSELPMPSVNIVVQGTMNGTSTNPDGQYKIQVKSLRDTLRFQYVGYETLVVPIAGRTEINVTLAMETIAGEEVVVTAQNIKRESREVGYSVQQLGPEEMSAARQTNFVSNLQGAVAGAQIKSSNTMGGSSRIVLRGINSISGDNQPLFVVDGVPIDNSNFNGTRTQSGEGGAPDYGNAAQDVDPNNIESVSVLKGPNAAALYGSRAANGAILITTKSGEARDGIGIDISTGLQANMPHGFPDYQNAYGGGYIREFDTFEFNSEVHPESWAGFDGQPMVDYSSDESWGPRMDGQMVRHWDSWYPGEEGFGEMRPFDANPNNVEDFFENGTQISNSIAFYGGGETSTFRASYSNLGQQGIVPNSSFTRHNVSLTGRLDVTDRLQVSSRVNYTNTKASGRPSVGDYSNRGRMGVMSSYSNWFQRQLDMDRLADYTTESGAFKYWNISSPLNRDPFYWVNPYFETNENTNNDVRERVFGYVSAAYDILDNWTVSGWVRTDFYNDRRERRVAIGHVNNSMYGQDIIFTREDNYQVLSEYTRQFNTIDVTFTSGGNVRYNQLESEAIETVGGITAPGFFNAEASKDRLSVTDYEEQVLVYALFGSVSLGYNDFLFVDASLRNDWSSTLPTENSSYLYPALSTSIVFSDLLPNGGVVNFGKLRLGWSQVGNATDPYRLLTSYNPEIPYGSTATFSIPNTLNNSDLKPETTTSVEMGLDLELFNGIIKPDVTLYRSTSENQIVDLPVASTSGYSSAIVNAGEIRNEGIEVSLSASPLRNPDGLNWDVDLNWARNRNEVIELTEDQENYQILSTGDGNGVSLNAREGEPYGVLVGDAIATNENGQRLVGEDGLYERDISTVLGNIQPDFTGGIRNTFTYKRLSVGALIDYQRGGDVYSVTSRTGMYAGLLEETVGLNDKGNPIRDPVSEGGGIKLEGVTADGQPNETYVEAIDYFKNMYDGQHVYDASYIKLREIEMSYRLPQSWFGSIPVQRASLSVVGRNLSILHRNIPHVDPEATMGSGNIQGYESAQLPRARTIGVTMRASF